MKSNVVILRRAYETDKVTMGMLDIYGMEHKPIFTLENPWLDNKTDISCIPDGTYTVERYDSPKYPGIYKVLNVEGRKDILIHWGNWEKDTEGCILIGTGAGELNGEPAVTASKKAVKYLRLLLGEEKFTLIIE